MQEGKVAHRSIHHTYCILLYTCSQPSITCLSCTASSVELVFPVWRPFSFGPSLVHLLVSSLSSQYWAINAQHGKAEWSGALLGLCGICHWRAVEHQRIHLYLRGPCSLRGCPSVKHYLEGCWKHRDRLGKMWTGQANIGLRWFYRLRVCALRFIWRDDQLKREGK